MVRWAH